MHKPIEFYFFHGDEKMRTSSDHMDDKDRSYCARTAAISSPAAQTTNAIGIVVLCRLTTAL